jgi:hypothetical protein
MPESGTDPPIIITGGSVTIRFDLTQLAAAGVGLDGLSIFSNSQKVIHRVQITGTGIENYDQYATDNDIEVTITYGTQQ